ncbi:MAG: DUF1576 domain-containing protein [Defluviitaleaceae bacterium]|nr:DUF1576 domain-containing protein [Defluviitaleaceae bacterium]
MAHTASGSNWIQYNFLLKPYRVHALLFVFYIIYGFIWASPAEIADGLLVILTAPNILVTDYIAIAGLGATFVNVGIMGLLAIAVLASTRHRPFGLDMGVLGLVTGFAFFGKNPLNMIPILLGAWLFSRFVKRPFEENLVPALLGNALAPAVSQLAHVYYIPTPIGIALGAMIGVFIGFTLSPLAAFMKRAHEGYNLYNVGFTAGIFAIILMALYTNLGISFEPRTYWSYGNNTVLMIFLGIVSAYFVIVGLLANTGEKVTLKQLLLVPTEDLDYFKWYREKIYISMGILGFAALGFMAVMQAEYTGLAIGAILSVIGFGAFGKSLVHAIPIVAGTMLADIANLFSFGTPLNAHGSLVAILFSTCLTPLSKSFGWKWGILAGYLHLSVATNISMFHGGMNLYNNGLAAGLVAMLLLPVIRAVSAHKNRTE